MSIANIISGNAQSFAFSQTHILLIQIKIYPTDVVGLLLYLKRIHTSDSYFCVRL